MAATLPSELHFQILLHLPAESLIRFKSVCKGWRCLISSRNFSLLHTLRHSTPTTTALGLLVKRDDSVYDLISNFKTPTLTPITLPGEVIHSCNGLLLCRLPRNAPAKYCIYNLATRLRRILHDFVDVDVVSFNLAFDPSFSPSYKLVCVRIPKSTRCFQISVFDSESSLWSLVLEQFDLQDTRFNWSNSVYFNNAIYKVPFTTGGTSFYFDIGKGAIDHVPGISRSDLTRACSHSLFESGGHLHYIVTSWFSDWSIKLTVFEMERDRSKWSLKYESECGEILNKSYVSVLSIVRNEQELSLLFKVEGKVMFGNLENFQDLSSSLNNVKDYHSSHIRRGDVHQFVSDYSDFC